MASTVTGSVAEIKAPKWSVSRKEKIPARCGKIRVTPYMKPPMTKVLMEVPMKAKVKIGSNVTEEKSFFHAVAGVEDDRRKQDVKEDLGVEGRLLVNLVRLCHIFNLSFKSVAERFVHELDSGFLTTNSGQFQK